MGPARKSRTTDHAASRPGPGRGETRPSAALAALPLPLELQQHVLDCFRRAFLGDASGDVTAHIQAVKGHLFSRDFAAAFARPEYLDAYACRWSASRALAYADLFLHRDLQPVWRPRDPSSGGTKVVCFGGGGGAEVAACAAVARALALDQLHVHAVDMADWAACLSRLERALTSPADLSQHASAGARAANVALVGREHFAVYFAQHDVLDLGARLRRTLADVRLCTVMFTLNELFAHSRARATAFLLALTDAMPVAAVLVIVDSPGSYAEVPLGADGQTKRYPMKWLLDHALLEVTAGRWRKDVADDSRWFRRHASLKYPLELENMRYQVHVYERVGPDGE